MTRPEAETHLTAEITKSGLTRKLWYRTVYLKSDHWKNLRTLALEHHGRKCHKCPATHKLDVHHIRYSSIYDVEVTDLQVLCRSCHEKEHAPRVVVLKTPKKKTKVRKSPKKKVERTHLTKKQKKRLKQRLLNEKKAYGRHMDRIQHFSWKRKGAGFV